MSEIPPDLLRQLQVQYNTVAMLPIARFFDYAEPDETLTATSGRPRFKHTVYVELITRGSAVREVFNRKMEEEDKQMFPKEWAEYCAATEIIANRRPSLMSIPGMDVSSYEELKALKLTDCEKLANYTGELQELERFRTIAQKIMEISNGLCQRRNEIQASVQRPVHLAGSVSRAGGEFRFLPIQTQQEAESFRYEIKVA